MDLEALETLFHPRGIIVTSTHEALEPAGIGRSGTLPGGISLRPQQLEPAGIGRSGTLEPLDTLW